VSPCPGWLCQEDRDARQSAGLQDEEQEAKEGRPALELRREQLAGSVRRGDGSLMTGRFRSLGELVELPGLAPLAETAFFCGAARLRHILAAQRG
jgi:hypothetical protein